MRTEQFDWGSMEWVAGAECGNSEQLAVARMTLYAGAQGDTHRHSNCEEVVYVVSGAVGCLLADQKLQLSAGQVLVIPSDSPHSLFNEGEEAATLLLTYGASRRQYEAVATVH